MKVEIKVPAVGEAVTEAVLAQWFRRDGDMVQKDEILFLMETDKVTLEIVAEAGGILHIQVPQGETVAIWRRHRLHRDRRRGREAAAAQRSAGGGCGSPSLRCGCSTLPIAPVREAVAPVEAAPGAAAPSASTAPPPETLPPSVRRLVAEKGLDVSQVQGTGPSGRITKSDVLLHLEQGAGGCHCPHQG